MKADKTSSQGFPGTGAVVDGGKNLPQEFGDQIHTRIYVYIYATLQIVGSGRANHSHGMQGEKPSSHRSHSSCGWGNKITPTRDAKPHDGPPCG